MVFEIHKCWETLGEHVDLNREKNFSKQKNVKQNMSQEREAVWPSCLPELHCGACLLVSSQKSSVISPVLSSGSVESQEEPVLIDLRNFPERVICG